jgi:hypothetical protein
MDYASCSELPSEQSALREQFREGVYYDFACYRQGKDINNDSTWDYIEEYDCYVAGAYTRCTLGKPICPRQ